VQKVGGMPGSSEEKERLNLYLPKDLSEELRRQVPARDRTRFIVEIIRRELAHKKLLDAIDNSYGAWRDEGHPELQTPEEIDRWIEEGRKEWNQKDWDE
jgi:hypothetical protein